MRAVEIIEKKRDGHELSSAEIEQFIAGYVSGEVADYQAAAWAMAVLWRGMTRSETVALTMAMVRSGETLDLHHIAPVIVDKHSTGGVGDKTTLVVAPLVAASGLRVAKMSGRGLGFTGGTLDKLESIPGMKVSLGSREFERIVRQHGVAVIGQTADLVPADGKLYALRDVTGTVPSLPLIASSIMSKKIAGGADAIILDVKVGRGAFMETSEEAGELAHLMIEIGQDVGRRVTAVLSSMAQPLGYAIGNALEVAEAIACLQGKGPSDLRELCLRVASEMLVAGGLCDGPDKAYQRVASVLDSGEACAKFEDWVAAQGGDPGVVAQPAMLPAADLQLIVRAEGEGFIDAIDARAMGLACVALGGGRQRKDDPIDPAVGLVMHVKIGDYVTPGQPLLTVHARSEASAHEIASRLVTAIGLSDTACPSPPLVYDVLRG